VPAPALEQGQAADVTASQAASLAVPPSDIASEAATYLNQLTTPQCPRPGLCAHTAPSGVQVGTASSLTDMTDLNFWRGQIGGALIVGDQHSAAADHVYALKTASGGALVWCAVSAELTLAAPGGVAMHLQIPTFYASSQAVTRASVPLPGPVPGL
jgi:hypothetical protein